MENYSIRLDLKKFRNAFMATIPGKTEKKRCICIPVDDNPEIYVGEKGGYLGLTAFPRRKTGQHGETHIVKGSIPKDIRDVMSEEERRAQPILGDMTMFMVERQELAAPEVSDVEVSEDLPF